MGDEGLRSCRYCGETPELHGDVSGFPQVVCKCGARGPLFDRGEQWNAAKAAAITTRAELAAALDALAARLDAGPLADDAEAQNAVGQAQDLLREARVIAGEFREDDDGE